MPAVEGDGLAIGVIPVDAVFTPVRKVNYTGSRPASASQSDFDRLILEVWTDGTISGTDAVHRAADILQREMSLFVHLGAPPPTVEGTVVDTLGLPPAHYNTSIEELNLSVRAYNCLKRSGLMTVGQVLERGDEELLGLRNFGDKSFYELMDRLRELGFVSEEDPRGRRPEISGAPLDSGFALDQPSSFDDDDDDENEEYQLSWIGLAGRAARGRPGRGNPSQQLAAVSEQEKQEPLDATPQVRPRPGPHRLASQGPHPQPGHGSCCATDGSSPRKRKRRSCARPPSAPSRWASAATSTRAAKPAPS